MSGPDQPREHRLPMRDGVTLATDVYLPESRTAYPTVLVRLPYGKRDRYVFLDQCAPFFTDRGYAFVVQDVRGTGLSEGETIPYVHEVHDGYDTLEWIVNQSWSNGAVGMFGDSYYGYTQWAALASHHPALRALVPRMASVELPFDQTEFPGRVHVTPTDAGPGLPPTGNGVSRPPSLGWAMALATIWSGAEAAQFRVDPDVRPPLAAFNAAFEQAGYRSAAFDRAIPEHQPDPVFPDGHPFDAAPVAILHTVGWFDPVAKRGMAVYDYLRRLPAWRDLQYLTADSVDHENYHLDEVPILEADDHEESDAALQRFLPVYLEKALDFFDAHLSAVDDPPTIPPVQWHLGGAGYRTSSTWPPPGAKERVLWLDDLGRAAVPGVSGSLDIGAPRTVQAVTWRHDPSNPVPAVGEPLSLIHDYADESVLEKRDDVLRFDSALFSTAVDLAGPVSVVLTVAADTDSLDVFAALLDVHPDGRVQRLLSDGVTVDVALGPRQVLLELGHLGYRLQAGHRLRLHVASSESPSFLVHPGVPGNRWLEVERIPAAHTLISTSASPSTVTITVLAGKPNDHDGSTDDEH